MRRNFWLLLFLFFVSRFFFLSNYPHFYDSPEYFRHSLSDNFFKTIAQSHESVHPVYILFIQLSQRLAVFIFGQSQPWAVSLVSAFFGLVCFLAFYLLIERLFGKKTALLASIATIFFPHLWLLQTNIQHEPVEHAFFLLGLLFFDYFLEKKRGDWLTLSVLSLALSVTNFVGILLWFPAIFGLAILRAKNNHWRKNAFWPIIVSLLSCLLGGVLLYQILSFSIDEPLLRLKTLLFGYGGKGVLSNWTLIDIFRMLKNDFLIGIYGYSLPVIFVSLFYLFNIFKKRKFHLLIFFGSFLLPFFVTGKFWYGGLFGRYSSFVAYPLALMVVLIPYRKIFWLVMVGLMMTFFPVFFAYQKEPVPKIQDQLIKESGFGKNDLLLLSDYQRPQLEFKNALYLGADRKKQKEIEEKIEKAIRQGQKVFISQQAVTFPYWQYDGQQIHIISRGDKDKAQLKNFIKNKKLILQAEEKAYPLLKVYEIIL